MKKKTLEELIAEREALTEALGRATKEQEPDALAEPCRALAMNFLSSIECAVNPCPEPAVFLMIFALHTVAGELATVVDGAAELAQKYASIIDVESFTVKFPRFKRRRDGEDGAEEVEE